MVKPLQIPYGRDRTHQVDVTQTYETNVVSHKRVSEETCRTYFKTTFARESQLDYRLLRDGQWEPHAIKTQGLTTFQKNLWTSGPKAESKWTMCNSRNWEKRKFSGGPTAKTLCPQCRGPGSIPGQGTWCLMLQWNSRSPRATVK